MPRCLIEVCRLACFKVVEMRGHLKKLCSERFDKVASSKIGNSLSFPRNLPLRNFRGHKLVALVCCMFENFRQR